LIQQQSETERDFTARYVISYSVGVYLAVNVIRDAFLVVDGPDCAYNRTQYIQGNHDYLSDLTSVSGSHRVVNTALDPNRVLLNREEEIRNLLLEIGRQPEVGAVLLTALPLAAVLSIDYQRLCSSAADDCGKPVLHVPGKSLSEDWLGGFKRVLEVLAENVSLKDAQPHPNRVALIGLPFDRNEEDCRGDVRELKRLLAALGLELVAAWPSGGDFSELSRVSQAGTIISLPYGRQAASILARRLDVRLLELELPFGLPACERWLRQLGRAYGREEQAEAVIAAEQRATLPALEWVVPFLFQGKRFGYIGDPHFLNGFLETIDLFGGTTRFAVVTTFAYHLQEDDRDNQVERLLVEPTMKQLIAFLSENLAPGKIDCLVSNSSCLEAVDPRAQAVVEFGFPSNNVHALYDRPRLGFRGALAFSDTLANQLRQFLALRRSR